MADPPIMDSYRRWWVGKYCRNVLSHGEFKLVTDVKWYGPPSGVYGEASLVFEDETEEFIRMPVRTPRNPPVYKPRKKDVEVWPRDEAPPRD